MKRKTKGYIVAVISILFSAFLIVLALALSNLAKGDIRERSQDVEDYRKWSVQEKYTQFLIFPEKIPAEAEEVEYYYQYESGWGRPMSQIYLSYRLDEDTYAKEQERLSLLLIQTALVKQGLWSMIRHLSDILHMSLLPDMIFATSTLC